MNDQNLKPFKKGDARINRKGRPRNLPALRELTVDILNEPATGTDGQPITANGKPVTKVEAIIRAAVQSKDPRQRQWAIELAYGKAPTQTEITGANGGPIQTQVFDHTAAVAAIAKRSGGYRGAPGADENDSDGA